MGPLGAIALFIIVFAVATLRGVHLGVLMFPAACGVGVFLAGLPLRDVVGGFPISIMVLLAGVTYFFGIAKVNGTIDALIGAVLERVGDRPAALPFVFFALTGAIAAMGSPIAALVLAPVAMPGARRSGVDPVLMAVAVNAGISAGGLAPTSLFGIVSYGAARQAGIVMSPVTIFAVAVAANFALLLVAFLIFGRRHTATATADRHLCAVHSSADADVDPAPRTRFERRHLVTIACMLGLVATVIATAVTGHEPDIGVLCFAFGALLALIEPASGQAAVARIDWSTVLLVGGIVTFVGVLQKIGTVDVLGQWAAHVGMPFVAALFICLVSGLVSAFASTTGILAALMPLAIPLIVSGAVSGWALISALGVCASIVDASPFSTTGATLIASAPEEERPRLTSLLIWWSMSMVVVGPAGLMAALVIPASL